MTPPLPKPPMAPSRPGGVKFGKIATAAGHRIVLYGTGGIGKTTLACQAPGPVAFFDLDESLPKLRKKLSREPLPVEVSNWAQLRDALSLDGWDAVKSIVIDSCTRAEELAVAHTLATVKTDKGLTAKSVEDYGYGKGFGHVFDTFLPILADLDRHARAGRNVILICHECTTSVPNPTGDDWLRYEPRLQAPASGKASIRLRAKEWADHVLFIGYDVAVDKEGKGKGGGSRTLWSAELPHAMAKSRTIQTPLVLQDGVNLWEQIIN